MALYYQATSIIGSATKRTRIRCYYVRVPHWCTFNVFSFLVAHTSSWHLYDTKMAFCVDVPLRYYLLIHLLTNEKQRVDGKRTGKRRKVGRGRERELVRRIVATATGGEILIGRARSSRRSQTVRNHQSYLDLSVCHYRYRIVCWNTRHHHCHYHHHQRWAAAAAAACDHGVKMSDDRPVAD